jgi:hypothetical protein
MENERNLIGSTDIQMVPNDSFKPPVTGLGTMEDAGLRYLELAESQLVPVPGFQVRWGERTRQTEKPPRKETLDLRRPQAIADFLQTNGIGAGTETVIQSLVANPGFL